MQAFRHRPGGPTPRRGQPDDVPDGCPGDRLPI